MDLKVRDIAEKLGVCEKTIYRKIAAGEIVAQRISVNCIRVTEEDFEAYRQSAKERKPYTRQK